MPNKEVVSLEGVVKSDSNVEQGCTLFEDSKGVKPDQATNDQDNNGRLNPNDSKINIKCRNNIFNKPRYTMQQHRSAFR